MEPGHVRGRDLPGAINVLPEGLGAVLAKRETTKTTTTSSSTTQSIGGGDILSSSMATSSSEQRSSMSETTSSSAGAQVTSSSSSAAAFSSSTQQQSESRTFQQHQQQTIGGGGGGEAIADHSAEIKPDLKTSIQSAMTDLERGLEVDQQQQGAAEGAEAVAVGAGAAVENGSAELEAGVQAESVTAAADSTEMSVVAAATTIRTPPKAPTPSRDPSGGVRLRLPHEFKGKSRPVSLPPDSAAFEPLNLPEVGVTTKKVVIERKKQEQSLENGMGSSTVVNGESHLEMTMSEQSSSMVTRKIFAPASGDDVGDAGSLKRRNPREMFTDSSFYSPKHHPSVADQVELAHKLSSSLYDDGNKRSKGQEMYMKRVKKSGADSSSDLESALGMPPHDKTPNMKLVMNPEGKVHDWTELEDEQQLPEIMQHELDESLHHVAMNMESCSGRGSELFAKRKKRSDKWVVDESNLGASPIPPSAHADKFVQQQMMAQEAAIKEKESDMRARMEDQNRLRAEAESAAKAQQTEQKMTFHRQQKEKQAQSEEMKIMQHQQQIHQQEIVERQQQYETQRQQTQQLQKSTVRAPFPQVDTVDLPPTAERCSLKTSEYSINSIDTSVIHNARGMDVWANNSPKPWNEKSSTLPRSHKNQQQGGMLKQDSPQMQLRAQIEQEKEMQRQQDLKRQQETFEAQEMQFQMEQQKLEQEHQRLEQEQADTRRQDDQEEERKMQEEQQLRLREEQFRQQQQNESQAQAQNEAAAEERKRQEYEEWLKSQEKEQQKLEYECSVKYEENKQELRQQQEEQQLILQQHHQEEQRLQQQQEELQLRLQQEKQLLQQQQEEQQRLIQQQQEQQRVQQQQEEEQMRQQEQMRLQQEQLRLQQQEEEQRFMQEQQMLMQQQQQQQQQQQMLQRQPEPIQPQQQQQEVSTSVRQESFQQKSSYEYQEQQQVQMRHEHKVRQQQQQQQRYSSYGESEMSAQQFLDDYTSTLRPTTTGAVIRSSGNVPGLMMSQAEIDSGAREVFANTLRPASEDPQQKRHSYVVNQNIDFERFDLERHSVRNLVSHYSKVAPPSEDLIGAAGGLSYLHQQNKQRDETRRRHAEMSKSEADQIQAYQGKYATREFLEMDVEGQRRHAAPAAAGIADPSAILGVDGVDGPPGRKALHDSYGSGEFTGELDKWDNHNAIARGWVDKTKAYHPVTFRKLYNKSSKREE